MLSETYWASHGGGAYLNERRLHVSSISSIAESAFCPNGLHVAEARPYLPRVVDLMQRCWSVRTYGGALDACLVAAGQAEIWFEPKVQPWDLAPLKAILEEAGAVFQAFDGSRSIEHGTAIGCAPGVLAQVHEALGIPPA
jgi:histidinol-phosphatase